MPVAGIGERPGARSYVELHAMGTTKTDTCIRDIPQSVEVINRQVIQDQRALTIRDALRNVSGVQ
ncbi:MAG: hypothetical protein C4294_04265 [Nitrospiraceae bacterium]